MILKMHDKFKIFKIYSIAKKIRSRMRLMHSYYPPINDSWTETDYWNCGREEGLYQALQIVKEVMNGK